MLVLTRKRSEKIVIADGIVIEVLEVRGGKVRLGVTAPDDVVIHRGENAKHYRETSSDGIDGTESAKA